MRQNIRIAVRLAVAAASCLAVVHSYVTPASASLASTSPPPPGSDPAVTITPDGVIVEWTPPSMAIAVQSDGTVSVTMPGYPQQNEPGETPLPVTSALVALPPGASPTIELLQADEQTVELPGLLRGNLPAIAEPIGLEMAGTVRGVPLARLVFYPARPVGNQLRETTYVRVGLKFNAPLLALGSSTQSLDPILKTLQATVVNPSQVQPLPAPVMPAPSISIASSTPQAAIEVNTPGITVITYAALAAEGFTVTNPNNLHLTRAGVEIAVQQDDAGGRLLFYAAPHAGRWATSDVYVLSEEITLGLRMTSRAADSDGLPAGVANVEQVSEQNVLYWPYCYCGYLPPGRDGDHWAWDELRQPDHASASYNINLPAVDATQPATLTVWLIGETDIPGVAVDHRVSAVLNGVALGQVDWDGKQAITATIPIGRAGVLQSGANSLRLTLPGISGIGVEAAWFDAFAIRYARNSSDHADPSAIFTGGSDSPHAYTIGLASTSGLRAYDVTDEDHPVALTSVFSNTTTAILGDAPATALPRRYTLAANSGLKTPQIRLTTPLLTAGNPTADYIIITPQEFAAALPPLIDLRESQNLRVVTETTQAIYDAYGGGRPTPDAIRNYLFNAYTAWPISPTYVLLFGDGTLDPKHYLSTSTNTFIPPYLADVDQGGGETAADNQYVASNGPGSLPNMAIGRLPVNTLAEAQPAVAKIVQYDTQPFPYGWTGFAAFVAGDSDPATAQYFAQESDAAVAVVPPPYVPRRLYYTPPVWVPEIPASFKQTVLGNWNSGAGVMVFTGHASNQQWIDQRLFHYDDVAGLTNYSRLPVLLEMTCFTSQFDIPDLNTLDEALVRHADGGTVAVWGSTGLAFSTGHQLLAHGFLNRIYEHDTTLGAAALAGKLEVLTRFSDLVDTYTLLGDPATRLDLTIVPWPYNMYLPMVRR